MGFWQQAQFPPDIAADLLLVDVKRKGKGLGEHRLRFLQDLGVRRGQALCGLPGLFIQAADQEQQFPLITSAQDGPVDKMPYENQESSMGQ